MELQYTIFQSKNSGTAVHKVRFSKALLCLNKTTSETTIFSTQKKTPSLKTDVTSFFF